MHNILLSEHSPIRDLNYVWEWQNLPSWVSVHFARHHIGCTPYVQTQRNDRQTLMDRRKAPQDTPVLMRMSANAQAIINISKVRLCRLAAIETRYAWELMLTGLLNAGCSNLVQLCVPKCVYRNGLCGEIFPCAEGVPTERLKQYRHLFKRG